MEHKSSLLEDLFEKAEDYAKTSVALYKLKAIDKSADVISTLAIKLIFVMVGFVMAIICSIGVSLWLGELMGDYYKGFFIVTGFYMFMLFIIYILRDKIIKMPLANSIILQMQKSKSL